MLMTRMVPVLQHKANDLERVIVYIDGYNVYHGLNSKGWRRLLWLDFSQLFAREMKPSQRLVAVKYFTATNRKQSKGATARQENYLRVLEAAGVDVRSEGGFRRRSWKCSLCEEWTERPQEKRTDVSIAIEMVHDAHHDHCDTFWLMCADEDLIPAVSYVKQHHSDKVVVIVSPRGRRSLELILSADAKRDVSRARLAAAQFPEDVTVASGEQLRRPPEWT